MQGFQIAGGSVPGYLHTKPGEPVWRNNQDAFTWRATESYLVAALCDGCGRMPWSEFGSRLGATLVTSVLAKFLDGGLALAQADAPAILSLAKLEMTEALRGLAAHAAEAERFLAEHCLYTIMGLVMDAERALIFALGDGAFAVNGDVTVLPAYEGNKPPYLAYHIVPSTLAPDALEFRILADLPTSEITSLMIGSDGVGDFIAAEHLPLPVLGTPVGPLSQFWEDESYTTNADKIRRRLAMANREWIDYGIDGDGRLARRPHLKSGLLGDDTTLVVVRRTCHQGEPR